ncbi:MAG: (cytosine-5)-methyltransferase 1 [Candidatus Diapherotrites archaeon]|nr:(cytosine-5)-methyltransferase 1 [Candidatus Diapherotrites archaeon]MDN5366748.1 (cytosine-5)-methyltransferase 1 [Candidatus Diapherotrites archaeon]
MRVLDLFAGAGGFARGFMDAGFEIVGAVEAWKYSAETYVNNFPGVRMWAQDIKTLDAADVEKEIGKPDVIIGGPPCEAFTVANAKREKEPLDRLYKDPRGRLTLHFIRFVGDLQPEVFVMENVLGIIEGDLKEALRYEFGRVGYEVKFNVLEASIYGVPSKRTRVFISPIRIRPKAGRRRTVWDAIGDLPDPRDVHNIPNHVYKPLPRRVEKVVHKLKWGQAPVYFKGAKRVHQNYIRLHPNRVAPTVMGSSRFIHPFSDRLLTVRENARLMSFPDDHVFYGPLEQQYNQAGEAVPPLLARKIAEVVLNKVGEL